MEKTRTGGIPVLLMLFLGSINTPYMLLKARNGSFKLHVPDENEMYCSRK